MSSTFYLKKKRNGRKIPFPNSWNPNMISTDQITQKQSPPRNPRPRVQSSLLLGLPSSSSYRNLRVRRRTAKKETLPFFSPCDKPSSFMAQPQPQPQPQPQQQHSLKTPNPDTLINPHSKSKLPIFNTPLQHRLQTLVT